MENKLTAEEKARSIISSATSSASKNYQIELPPTLEEIYLYDPTHRNAGEILSNILGSSMIYEKETGQFYELMPPGYYTPVYNLLTRASHIIDAAVLRAFQKISENLQGQALQLAYSKTGSSRKRAQTKDFVKSAISFFAESVHIPNLPSKWNNSSECLPTLTGIIDFSGDELILRGSQVDEYFKDPLPIEAEDILKGELPVTFLLTLKDFFPDPQVFQTALESISLAVANRGTRTFLIFHGATGANGKNTLFDILRVTLPGRVGVISASSIIRGQDGGAKRFGTAELEGKTFAAVDEVSGSFDVAEVKRLTGGSVISIERKGQNPYEIPQTWTLVALTNRLPSFQPATDSAFLQRLIIVPFETVFYFDLVQKEAYLRLGIDESKLKLASDKVSTPI